MNEQTFRQQLQIEFTPNKKQKIAICKKHKVIVIVAFSTFYLLYYFIYSSNLSGQQCIYDWTHQITTTLNQSIHQNQQFQYWLLIIAQIIIDIFLVFLISMQLFKSQNFSIPFWMGIFYGIRGIFLNVEIFPFPQGYYWEDPGFPPSLSVPYGKTRDFFYSGHSGFLAFCWLVHLKIKNPSKIQIAIKYFAFIAVLIVMLTLIITRVHYIIDIVAAWIFSLQLFCLVFRYLIYVDSCFSAFIYFIKNVIQLGYEKIRIACNIDQ